MGGGMILFVIVGVIPCILSMATASHTRDSHFLHKLSCACDGNKDDGVMIAAASDPSWDNGAICGKTFTVTCTGPTNPVPHPCTGNTVTVKIVDHCAPDAVKPLDLSTEAFATIADPVAGIIKIDYNLV